MNFLIYLCLLMMVLCINGQRQDEAMLTSRCVSSNLDIEMTCTAQDVQSLRWFFNGNDTASFLYAFSFSDVYPLVLQPLDSILSNLHVTIESASAIGDRFNAVSILSANLEILLMLGVDRVRCGPAPPESQSESVVISSNIQCHPSFSLMTQPQTTGAFCPGSSINFTCVGTEIISSLSWIIGHVNSTYTFQDNHTQFPIPLAIDPPLEGVTVEVASAFPNPTITNTFDVTFVLRARDVSVLNGTTLQCENAAAGGASDEVLIQVTNTRLMKPPSPSLNSCSVMPSSGGAKVFLQWSPSFTSQHLVERYQVSVNPDPSFCSSDQVSFRRIFSCSQLVLGEPYTLTAAAINCGDQQGEGNTFTVKPQLPATPVEISINPMCNGPTVVEVELQWSNEFTQKNGNGNNSCDYENSLNYTVLVKNNTDVIIEQNILTMDSCDDSVCLVNLSSSDILADVHYTVTVVASNIFGSSNDSISAIFCPPPVSIGILITGISTFVMATVVTVLNFILECRSSLTLRVVCCNMRKYKITSASSARKAIVFIVVHCFLLLVTFCIWIIIALWALIISITDASDIQWQSARKELILSSSVISIFTFITVTVLLVVIVIQLCTMSKPEKLPRPKVDEEDRTVITWTNDCHNDTVYRYDIRYDADTVDHASAKECLDGHFNKFRFKIKPDKLMKGKYYSVAVRAVNRSGQGDWSDKTGLQYLAAPPNKPPKPSVELLSAKAISVQVNRPSQRDSNGSTVTHYKIKIAWNNTSRHEKVQISKLSHTINQLTSATTYIITVKWINSEGESVASDENRVTTLHKPPQNLRLSTKYSESTLKIRWNEPDESSSTVAKYRAQMDQGDCQPIDKYTEKLSAKFTLLQSKTKYSFRVCAISNRGVEGEWSERIQGETRDGPTLRALKTVAEAGKGTVLAPFKGGKIGSEIGDEIASDQTDSAKFVAKAGGRFAGGILRAIASPFVGIAKGVKAHKKLTGKSDKISPQTSDDDDESYL